MVMNRQDGNGAPSQLYDPGSPAMMAMVTSWESWSPATVKEHYVDHAQPRLLFNTFRKQRLSPRFAHRGKVFCLHMDCFEKRQRHHHLLFLCGLRSCESVVVNPEVETLPTHLPVQARAIHMCCFEEDSHNTIICLNADLEVVKSVYQLRGSNVFHPISPNHHWGEYVRLCFRAPLQFLIPPHVVQLVFRFGWVRKR